jgi:uncharacterized protein (DUF4415 family)
MTENKRSTDQEWDDPDDAPDLSTPEWLAKFDPALVSRGRPRLPSPKISTTLRLDADVMEHFRKDGPGWQSRINAVLRESMKRT